VSTDTLTTLVGDLLNGRVRVVDLTQTLATEFPTLELPPQFGQCAPLKIEQVSKYDESGPGWYWNNFSCNEHTGTHFDAPIHWITGRDLPNNSTDRLPVEHLVGLACVIDCTAKANANPDYLLTVADLKEWEAKHGRIPAKSWVLMRTDWSKHTMSKRYKNMNETGQHTPGPTAEAIQFLIDERDIRGFGTETIGTDAGQAYAMAPQYPAHHYLHGAGRYGLQCLTNLDQLPPRGAVIICPPLKLKQGSGSPLRVLALVGHA
jgi:kynurenine formamidase